MPNIIRFLVVVWLLLSPWRSGSAATVEEVVKKASALTGAERKTFLEEGAKKEAEIVFYTSLSLTDYPKILPHFEKSYPFIKTNTYRGARRQIRRRRDRVGAGGDVAVEAAQVVGSLPVA
jgi:hypothetical protein